MKILYYYKEEWEKDYVSSKLQEHEIMFVQGALDDASIPATDAEVLSVFVNSPVSRETIGKFPNLKLIATRSTGYDHIDMAAVAERGIQVASVPSYGENTVAEFAFALLLNVSRRVAEAYERIARTGSFSQDNLRGFDLEAKTLGVVGTGHIGAHVIKIAKGFGMEVLAYDVRQDDALAHTLGFRYVTLDELLGSSDVITLHAPYNEHTHHLLNRDAFAKVKKGAYLINTARGGLVETEALVWALQGGIIAGAGLDVLEEEGVMGDEFELLHQSHPKLEELQTVLANHYFIDHPRVIVTPHIAFNTTEAITRILDTTITNIQTFASGSLNNIVKPH